MVIATAGCSFLFGDEMKIESLCIIALLSLRGCFQRNSGEAICECRDYFVSNSNQPPRDDYVLLLRVIFHWNHKFIKSLTDGSIF